MVPSEPVSQSPTSNSPTHLLTYSLYSPVMADKFDPYREALIVEVETQWPEEYDDWEPGERARVERLLHQTPEQARSWSTCERTRVSAGGFVVTPDDIARVTA